LLSVFEVLEEELSNKKEVVASMEQGLVCMNVDGTESFIINGCVTSHFSIANSYILVS
jgi:hypothetical protein